ncbi:hypothetical protein IAT38_004129 [Cryptococcus sp. DSM 104549]
MSDDWDIDDEPVNSGSSTPAPVLPPKAPAKKWADEDKDEEEDDWDVSDEEKPKPKAAAVAPPKKKMSLKQKLAEKEKLAAEKKANGGSDDEIMDTMTEQERRRLAREMEQEADLNVAADLMGGASLDDNVPKPLESILSAKPSTKGDFAALSKDIYTSILQRHEGNPLYAAFVEQLAKDMSEALTAVQTRKVSSALSVLGNTKQQEERDKASGKKKASTKPKLGGAKVIAKVDTAAYDDVLEDDDFM